MRVGTSARVAAMLAALLLITGTVIAADPSAAPSASGRGGTAAGSPDASASPSLGTSGPAATNGSAPSTGSPDKVEPSESPEASEKPEGPETAEAPPTDAEIADFVGRLKAAGITTTAAVFKSLAAKVGVGGAVRTLAFAQASGKTPAQILAMFDGGMGWGRIGHELGLKIGPGIGWIMRGGHGDH
jgi:hypothetical protein